MTVHKGSCLCGAVTFEVAGKIPAPDACHCKACRKSSGHYFVSADVPRSAITITGENHVRWFQSSEKARRGFCSACGSSLFWDPFNRDWIGVAMGALDGATEAKLHVHVFVGEKGDYYDIADGVPQFETIPPLPQPRPIRRNDGPALPPPCGWSPSPERGSGRIEAVCICQLTR